VVIHNFRVLEVPIGGFDQRLSTSVLLPPCFPRISNRSTAPGASAPHRFWSSHDKAHLPAKYASSRQEAWLPRPHGYPCRTCSSLCSPR